MECQMDMIAFEEECKQQFLTHIDTCNDCIRARTSHDPHDVCDKGWAILEAFEMMKKNLLGTETVN